MIVQFTIILKNKYRLSIKTIQICGMLCKLRYKMINRKFKSLNKSNLIKICRLNLMQVGCRIEPNRQVSKKLIITFDLVEPDQH